MGCRPHGNDPQGGLARARWYSPKIHAGSAARALGPEILETLWAAATLTRGGANFKILRTNPLSAVESVADFDRPVI